MSIIDGKVIFSAHIVVNNLSPHCKGGISALKPMDPYIVGAFELIKSRKDGDKKYPV